MKKLAIISTHPIQYNAPLFQMLTNRAKISIKVFYTWENSQKSVYDRKFQRNIEWDIPLLENYDYQFVKNIAKEQGSHHWRGIINPTLVQDIENWQADAVLIFAWNFHSHFKVMRYFKGTIPVLFRGDSTLLDETGGLKTLLRRLFLKFVYRYIDYALYVGRNNKKYFSKHGVSDNRLVFAPHSVDSERFMRVLDAGNTQVNKWKEELKLSDEDIVFLFAGKFEAKKNPLFIIELAKKLRNHKFILAGSGHLEDKIKSESSVLSNVILLPFQNQSVMPVLYRLADAFILPSKGPGETWALSINEAMACGRAIFASNKVGSAIDLVENGKNGFIFDTNNTSELIRLIKGLNKQKITEMGFYSSEIIKQFSYDKVCEAIENLVKTI